MKNKPGAIIIEGHVQGLANTRALGKAGIPVYVIDTGKCVAQHSKYCMAYFNCPDYQSDKFADFLVELAEKENLQDWILLPSNDHAVYTISKHKKKLEKYYKFTIQDLSIITNIYNKAKLLAIAEKCNVPIPETVDNARVSKHHYLKYPVLTRGKEGKSFYYATGRKAFLAFNINDLDKQIEFISSRVELSKTITQELIPYDGTNKTVSFTAFCINGDIKTYWMGVKLREHPIQFGTATLAESVYIEECLISSKKLLKKMKYTGVCEVEFLKDPRDNKYKLIEINPRTWLWVGLAIECGINYPLYIYNYLKDLPNEFPEKYQVGFKWYNPYTDLAFSLRAIINGKLSVRDYVKQLKGKKFNALWDWNDLLPFFIYGKLLLKMIKER